MSDAVVRLDREDRVATLTLNQPDRLNSLSTEIYDELETILADLEEENIGCLVIQGAGRAFSAGGDIDRMRQWLERDEPVDHLVQELERSTRDVFARLVAFPAPTVAKIDGAAVGAGASLAIACDLQVASERSTIGFVFRNVGLNLDSGVSYTLPRMVGTNIAKKLVYTGEILEASDALELGLLNDVYPDESFDEEVDALVQEIASGPTIALRHAKRLLDEGSTKSFDQAITDEWTAQAIVFETEDHEEGVTAFLEDREPQFQGR